MGMLMWPEYYFLTGDMRAREAIEHLGDRARAMLWPYNYDDKNDGSVSVRVVVTASRAMLSTTRTRPGSCRGG